MAPSDSRYTQVGFNLISEQVCEPLNYVPLCIEYFGIVCHLGIGSKLKKAAVIGAVAYGSYQIGKLSAGYSSWTWGQQNGYQFSDWNRWREADGFLCRNTSDCSWIDRRLYCQDNELTFTPSSDWFGGGASIVGECSCPEGMYYDDDDMECEDYGVSGWVIALATFLPRIGKKIALLLL